MLFKQRYRESAVYHTRARICTKRHPRIMILCKRTYPGPCKSLMHVKPRVEQSVHKFFHGNGSGAGPLITSIFDESPHKSRSVPRPSGRRWVHPLGAHHWHSLALTGVLVGFLGFILAIVSADHMAADGMAVNPDLANIATALQQLLAEQQAPRTLY